MTQYPNDLKYTPEHEWVRIEQDTVCVGITQYAVEQLGDVTLVDLPAVGTSLQAGARFGDIESVKTVSELFAPVAGEVIEVNQGLETTPELVNADPYTEGWMIRIRPLQANATDSLMNAEAYSDLVRKLEP